MIRRFFRLGISIVGVLFVLAVSGSAAQSPETTTMYAAPPGAPVCNCAAYAGSHIHLAPAGTTPGRIPGARRPIFGRIDAPLTPNEQGLPRGRRYYGGRYFGGFSNRYYGPQYGYF